MRRDQPSVSQSPRPTGTEVSMRNEISILVVDDESLMRNLIFKILGQEDYRIELAGSAEEALESLSRKEFQLVISDIKMPGQNGIELLKKIKADHPQTGVVMMTAYGDTYTVREVLLSGAEEYITKPFKSKELNAAVERAYWRVLSSQVASGKAAPENEEDQSDTVK
jgi:two-component system response regulator PilR (NtrC family)